ncbi:MAG: bifunctional glycosyltransferase family 2/GtrA family protein [Desulfarculus sp.]|nr:bifunctional glycosyltransferase family 2/GtrA family protein [Desulfarculus sp.]
MNVTVLIPAYNPNETLLSLVEQLHQAGFGDIVVVDDGSHQASQPVFTRLEQSGQVTLLRHAVNLGKGAALRMGFNHAYIAHQHDRGYLGVITADADGQHLPADIAKIAQSLAENQEALILGVRSFQGQVPFRSRFGNSLTQTVFRFLVGEKITDTQTGLRGVPLALIPIFLRITANRYEYELDMLIQCATTHHPIVQVPIATVYIDDNRSSHFNPIVDSAKIYLVFLRFIGSSLLTALVDNLVFILVLPLWTGFLANADHALAASTALARAASILVNFTINKKYVFRHQEPSAAVFIKFVLLVAVMGVVSFSMIKFMGSYWGFAVIPAKIVAETVLYLVNFATQRTLVFRSQDAH